MPTLDEVRTLHTAIANLSDGENLSKAEVEIILATLKRAESIIYPSHEELFDYGVDSIDLNCLDPERFPEVYRDLEASLIAFEEKFQLKG